MAHQDEHRWSVHNITILVCLAICAILLWHAGLLFGHWTAIFALITSIVSLFPNQIIKTGLFLLGTIALIIFTIISPQEWVSEPGLNTLHWSCRKNMIFTVYDEEKRLDEDHDGFSVDCEEQGHGDDHDATKIPTLPGLEENIRPSFNAQFRRDCDIAAAATAFDIYHAGLIGKRAESYRFNIHGASQLCPIGEEERKDAKMRCAFSPEFLTAFQRIQQSEFSMTVQVTVEKQKNPEEFLLDCKKS